VAGGAPYVPCGHVSRDTRDTFGSGLAFTQLEPLVHLEPVVGLEPTT
jgi:hypothetical protein